MKRKWAVRVVVASPNDVRPERDELEMVVSNLNRQLRAAEIPAFIELLRYETDAHPGIHGQGPQGIIDSQLRIEDSDVLIGIFWKRFGTPVYDAGSGTEHEIRRAINTWKAKGTPQVMLYFSNNPYDPNSQAEIDQLQALQGFRQELIASGELLFWEYQGNPLSFGGIIQKHLLDVTMELLRKTPEIGTPSLRFHFSAKPVVVRGEGIAELLGDLFLRCVLDSPTPPKEPLWFSVLLALPTQVTSRLGNNNRYEPEPLMIEVGRPDAVARYRCSAISGNIAVFAHIQLDNIQPHETRIFQIGNIRCNANGVGPPGPLRAYLSVSGAPVENALQDVAKVAAGFKFEVRNRAGTDQLGGCVISRSKGLPLSRVATLRFVEGFHHAFKSKLPIIDVPLFRDDPVVIPSECYSFGSTIRSSDTGTCLKTVFHNLPDTIRLFVSTSEVSEHFGIRARLVDSHPMPEGAGAIEFEGLQIKEVGLDGHNYAEVVWEVVHPGQRTGPDAAFVEFGVFVSCDGKAIRDGPSLGMAIVNGSLGPTSTVTTASLSAPIPRFIDTSTARSLLTLVP
jgi:hypothetical protein